ncbi:unnamed protein product [Notodromas monacha]|uniref:RGS domain-containing protein n=1 Tax=Notodromas monacha TaxID=399045 RepID=A0A7R9BBV8_9CRUS|nr:unnamed protein product [Notodromas monacha]CAG0912339.1 unnamed protein product [Notodromas monacha]
MEAASSEKKQPCADVASEELQANNSAKGSDPGSSTPIAGDSRKPAKTPATDPGVQIQAPVDTRASNSTAVPDGTPPELTRRSSGSSIKMVSARAADVELPDPDAITVDGEEEGAKAAASVHRMDSVNSMDAFHFPEPPEDNRRKGAQPVEEPEIQHSPFLVFCCSRCLVPLDEIRNWGNSFDALMKHEKGRKLFSAFLRHEFSEENMLFWTACEDLKKETCQEKMAEQARIIYNDYVSLDARERERINKRITKPAPEIFVQAQSQIFVLMQRDSYQRFIMSWMYLKVAHYKKDRYKQNNKPHTTNSP